MEHIVARLIEARHSAKLSLEDIHQRTKIPLRQLEYLESYQFDKIGPSVYIKGFVRRYAQEVGLDPRTLLEEENSNIPAVSSRAARRTRQPVRINIAPFLKICAVLILLVLVGFLIHSAVLTFFEPSPPAPPDTPPLDQPDPNQGGDDQDPPGEEPEPEVVVEQIEADETGEVYLVRNTEELDIVLTYSGNCWTRVTVDGERVLEATFRKGHQEQVNDGEIVLLRFGAPRYVSVSVNGVEVELPDIQRGYNLEFRLEQETE